MTAPRHSQIRHTGPLIGDPTARAQREASNALLQFDEVRRLIAKRSGNLRLSPDDVCELQRLAVDGIFECAGQFRKASIGIGNTTHVPPPWEAVAGHVAEMCRYANSVADQPFQVSAYLMWRLNWIHPFADGNGRTSRAISYLALCCGLGIDLPGTVTVPDLIVQNRRPYYHALDAADAACKNGDLDVSQMDALIRDLLTQQLKSAV